MLIRLFIILNFGFIFMVFWMSHPSSVWLVWLKELGEQTIAVSNLDKSSFVLEPWICVSWSLGRGRAPCYSSMQVGNLDTISRNSMKIRSEAFMWSPFDLIDMKHVALGRSFKRIKNESIVFLTKHTLCKKKNCLKLLK